MLLKIAQLTRVPVVLEMNKISLPVGRSVAEITFIDVGDNGCSYLGARPVATRDSIQRHSYILRVCCIDGPFVVWALVPLITSSRQQCIDAHPSRLIGGNTQGINCRSSDGGAFLVSSLWMQPYGNFSLSSALFRSLDWHSSEWASQARIRTALGTEKVQEYSHVGISMVETKAVQLLLPLEHKRKTLEIGSKCQQSPNCRTSAEGNHLTEWSELRLP